MALSLASISAEAVTRAPRGLVLGPPKIGKSEFACGASFKNGKRVAIGLNNPIVLPISGEEGVDSLPVPKFPTLGSVSEVLEALWVLRTEDHKHDTVVIDSATSLERLIWAELVDKHNAKHINDGKVLGFANGFKLAAKEFGRVLKSIDVLREKKNMASFFIGHVEVKRFDDPDASSYDRYQFSVQKEAAALFEEWADVTLFCNSKVFVQTEDVGFNREKKRAMDVTGGQRFLFTQQRPSHPGGGRGDYGHLPYELPLDYAVFQEEVRKAMHNTNEGE